MTASCIIFLTSVTLVPRRTLFFFFVKCFNAAEFNTLPSFCLFLQNPALQTFWPFSYRKYFSGIHKSVNVTRRSGDVWHTSYQSKGNGEGTALNQTLTGAKNHDVIPSPMDYVEMYRRCTPHRRRASPALR